MPEPLTDERAMRARWRAWELEQACRNRALGDDLDASDEALLIAVADALAAAQAEVARLKALESELEELRRDVERVMPFLRHRGTCQGESLNEYGDCACGLNYVEKMMSWP